MVRPLVAAQVQSAIDALVSSGRLPRVEYPAVEIQDTKQPEHGDLATNWAMVAFKMVSGAPSSSAGMHLPEDEEGVGGGAKPANPRALGDLLATELAKDPAFSKVDVAGPGFVNLTLAETVLSDLVRQVLSRSNGSILDNASHFARPSQPSPSSQPSRINLEFVSVNPNGPITIGSGRGAAYGSTLANVLQAAGHKVHREYYINDGVNSEQMRLFAESVKAVCEGRPIPVNGYKGDYVSDVAARIGAGETQNLDWFQQQSQALMLSKQNEDLAAFGVTFDTWFSEQSLHDSGKVQQHIDAMIAAGVADENPERTKLKLGKGGVIEEVVREPQNEKMEEDEHSDATTTQDNSTTTRDDSRTLWLRSTLFGDDMDRVLRRKDGRLTYIASDVAYHADKFNRPVNADKLITVLGPDHHGYINRLHAVVAAELMSESGAPSSSAGMHVPEDEEGAGGGDPDGASAWASDQERDLYHGDQELKSRCQTARQLSDDKLTVQIFQLVRFMKDGKPAPMRKRDGNIYALIDLVNEIGAKVKPNGSKEEQQEAGKDVARFFYLMRNHDTTFDFDLDLAEKQSDENPVFYVQYAHARICSVLEKASSALSSSDGRADEERVEGEALHPRERALILKIADLPYEIHRCADDYGVNRLTTYAMELARTYHGFYDACRVIDPENPQTTAWRVQLCQATKAALKATFDVLGISAPERMTRDTTEGASVSAS